MPASSQQRAISALLVLLLHAVLLFAFLQYLVKPQSAGLPNPERLLELMIRMPGFRRPRHRPRLRDSVHPSESSQAASNPAGCRPSHYRP
jgi:hypothetical protein